jgi:hypothetical protein
LSVGAWPTCAGKLRRGARASVDARPSFAKRLRRAGAEQMFSRGAERAEKANTDRGKSETWGQKNGERNGPHPAVAGGARTAGARLRGSVKSVER